MREYIQPEMEIDLFEDDGGLFTSNSGVACSCDIPGCPINFSYGEGKDPWN